MLPDDLVPCQPQYEQTEMTEIPIYCGADAIGHFMRFCREQQRRRFLLVADRNTFRALGARIEAELVSDGCAVRTTILEGETVIADERRVFDVLYQAGGEEWLYLGVGSGTITDITRYASFCSRNPFVSLPTAPSVDAYAAGGAALVMGGYKLTVRCQAPIAIYADLATLCEAPYPLAAAGFGDILGKFTSLADWRLGALLLDERFDISIFDRSRRALFQCVAQAEAIGQLSATGIQALIHGLFESGLCMMLFGSSRPASGAEHLFSHFWDIGHLHRGQAAILHGAQVGVGTILAARRYDAIRGLMRDDVAKKLSTFHLPNARTEVDRIRRVFAPIADRIIAVQLPFLQMLDEKRGVIAERILDRWSEIQGVVADVPEPAAIARILATARTHSEPAAIGLDDTDVQDALRDARYLRPRFTVDTLGRFLGMW
jgi:glycerol-1-phosphate dehydrogenase [NAD(P)+]